MPAARIVHVITPGDHFSPRTGSAVPTVVDGLARTATAAGAPRQAVAIDRSTFRPRYDSADVIEFDGVPRPPENRFRVDALGARIGMPRHAALRYFTPVARALEGLPATTVLAHNAPLLPWLLRRSPHRVVLYAHNDLFGTYTRREAAKRLEPAAAIVCVSESLAERTRRRLPASFADRVHVVPNGVDADAFSPRAERTPGPLRVMFMGRVIPDKGAEVLVRAAASLARDDIEVVVVGRPGFAPDAPLTPYETTLRDLAARSPTPVRFEGFVARPELSAVLRRADVFVVPSQWPDPAPLTVGEALATGLPVIASRIGGIPELVGETGVLVPPGDAAALAAALGRLIDDPAERGRLAEAARARALSHDWGHSWRALAGVVSGL